MVVSGAGAGAAGAAAGEEVEGEPAAVRGSVSHTAMCVRPLSACTHAGKRG